MTGQRSYLATMENQGLGASEPIDPETVYEAVTSFVAMPFNRNEDGDLVPGEVQER